MTTPIKLVTSPIVDNNPVTLQILGICSALALTTSVATSSSAMSFRALTGALVRSALISAIRHHIPGAVRLILQITIIASLVIVIDLLLQAFAFEISQRLSIFALADRHQLPGCRARAS